MSFRISWPKFSKEFLESAKIQLTEALNKGDEKPPNIVGEIVVKELYMGAKAPDLEILEIGELSEERFKGVFKLNYSGDGYIVMRTRVQVRIVVTVFGISVRLRLIPFSLYKPT